MEKKLAKLSSKIPSVTSKCKAEAYSESNQTSKVELFRK